MDFKGLACNERNEFSQVSRQLVFQRTGLLYPVQFWRGTTSEKSRRDLLEVLEDRYSKASTIITSQLPVSEWRDYFGGGRIADAPCDRLIRNAHRIEMEGPSRRPEVDTKSTDPLD